MDNIEMMQPGQQVMGPQAMEPQPQVMNRTSELQQLELNNEMIPMTNRALQAHLINDLVQGIKTLANKKTYYTRNSRSDVTWKQYQKWEAQQLATLSNKSEAAIATGIGGYNVIQRRFDNMNINLKRGTKSNYLCGTETCKERGLRIKSALYKLSTFSPESLGNIGVGNFVANAGNWATRGITRGLVGAPASNAAMPNGTMTPQAPGAAPKKRFWLFGGKRTRRKRTRRNRTRR